MNDDHTCPPGHLYVCPTAREVESSCHGGFDTCCDRPDLHVPIPDGPGAEALSVALSEAAKREFLLHQGAIERSAMLEECRDLLESAGHNGAHGDDWPEVGPAVRALIADRDRLRTRLDEYRASRERWMKSAYTDRHDSLAAHAAIDRVRALHVYNEDADYCNVCADGGDIRWPCATIAALDGTGEA